MTSNDPIGVEPTHWLHVLLSTLDGALTKDLGNGNPIVCRLSSEVPPNRQRREVGAAEAAAVPAAKTVSVWMQLF